MIPLFQCLLPLSGLEVRNANARNLCRAFFSIRVWCGHVRCSVGHGRRLIVVAVASGLRWHHGGCDRGRHSRDPVQAVHDDLSQDPHVLYGGWLRCTMFSHQACPRRLIQLHWIQLIAVIILIGLQQVDEIVHQRVNLAFSHQPRARLSDSDRTPEYPARCLLPVRIKFGQFGGNV